MTEKTASHPPAAATVTPLPPLNQRNARPATPASPRSAQRTVAPVRRGKNVDTTASAKPRKGPPQQEF